MALNQRIFNSRDIPLNISHFLDHFIMLIFAKAAFDSAVFFGISYAQIILYGTVGLILFGAAAPVASILAERYSRRLLLIIFPFGVGLSSIFAGASQNLMQLGVCLSFIGLFASIYHPVGIAMLMKNKVNLGFRLGLNGVWGNMGVAAAPLITGFLILLGDWRLAFILPGSACLVFGFWLIYSKYNEEISSTKGEGEGDVEAFSQGWERAMLSLVLITVAGGFTFGALTFLIPRYFEIYLSGISENIAVTGLLAASIYAVASFSQIISGWIIDRKEYKGVLLFIGFGQIVFIYFAAQTENFALLLAMLFGMAFVFGQIPIGDAILSAHIPDKYRSQFLSVKFLLNLCIGAMILPLTSILLTVGYHLNFLFLLLSVVPVLVIIGAFILPVKTTNQIKVTS
jgi:MFS family permease